MNSVVNLCSLPLNAPRGARGRNAEVRIASMKPSSNLPPAKDALRRAGINSTAGKTSRTRLRLMRESRLAGRNNISPLVRTTAARRIEQGAPL